MNKKTSCVYMISKVLIFFKYIHKPQFKELIGGSSNSSLNFINYSFHKVDARSVDYHI